MKRTAVVILNYNGIHFLEKYLHLVVDHTPDAEIIVADNASTDGSVEWLASHHKEIRTIILDKNYGFAEGYNKALRQVENEYYVLLNSDVRTSPNWLSPIITYMDNNPNCAAAQPKILSEENPEKFEYAGAAGGFIDKYGYPFCRGRIMGNVEEDNGQYDTISEVFWATGACLVIRRDEYWNNGALDGRFFAHQEEIDLCWRLKARGKSIVCIPESKIYHVGGGSLNYESPFKTRLNFRNNALLLYKNVHGGKYIYIRTVRIFLDIVAAMQMLFQKKQKNAAAVIKANIEFEKIKGQFREDRRANLSMTSDKLPYGMLNTPLLWQVYIKRRDKFKEISSLLETK